MQNDEHLLAVLRYIEANPLRAGMVTEAAAWLWSSYAAHGLGRPDQLLRELPAWAGLGSSESARRAYWRRYVHRPQAEPAAAAIRLSLLSGRPYGSPSWVKRSAAVLGIPLSQRPRGRPRTAEK